MLLCQNCYAPYANLNPQIGDKVKCLLTTDTWHRTEFGKTYTVCALVKNDPGTIYIDVGDGWQRKLLRGEYLNGLKGANRYERFNTWSYLCCKA